MRKLAKVVLVILLLPVVGLASLYLIGLGMTRYMEMQQESVRAEQEEISSAGNGFGGDPGMVVVDSGYFAEQFYWLDNDHLVLNKKWIANTDKNEGAVYVWNVSSNEVKPVQIYGRMFCALGTDVYFYDGNLESRSASNPDHFSSAMRGNLVESGDVWKFENAQQLNEIWPVPDERYELAWARGCVPWFRVKTDRRSENDLARYRFKLLPEWGWVMRFPARAKETYDNGDPEMGFFSIGRKPYFEQSGAKVSALADWSVNEMIRSELRYVDFLDKYWMAILHGDTNRGAMTGFVTLDGHFHEVKWDEKWPQYSDLPLPTRKGLFWSGTDFRVADHGYYDAAYFFQDKNGVVHTVVIGDGNGNRLSEDGCRVAFYNAPRHKLGATTLKVFDVCKSTVNEKEFENVEY